MYFIFILPATYYHATSSFTDAEFTMVLEDINMTATAIIIATDVIVFEIIKYITKINILCNLIQYT